VCSGGRWGLKTEDGGLQARESHQPGQVGESTSCGVEQQEEAAESLKAPGE
jgi:hypothetical protein